MNQRDRLFIQREWIAWADWVRQGQTCPNTLGYKSQTVEYSLMRGDTGGDSIGGSKVPLKYSYDNNAEILNRIYWGLPTNQQQTITGVFYHKETERSVAFVIGATRHQVRRWLSDSYIAGFEALTTKNNSKCVVSV